MDLSQLDFRSAICDYQWNKRHIFCRDALGGSSWASMIYLASSSTGPPPAIKGITWSVDDDMFDRWYSDQLFRYKLMPVSSSSYMLNLEVVGHVFHTYRGDFTRVSVSDLSVGEGYSVGYHGNYMIIAYGYRNFKLLFQDGFLCCWAFSHKTLPWIDGVTWEFKVGNDCEFKSNERFSIDSLGALRRIS
jgi:hypothetical protein